MCALCTENVRVDEEECTSVNCMLIMSTYLTRSAQVYISYVTNVSILTMNALMCTLYAKEMYHRVSKLLVFLEEIIGV